MLVEKCQCDSVSSHCINSFNGARQFAGAVNIQLRMDRHTNIHCTTPLISGGRGGNLPTI